MSNGHSGLSLFSCPSYSSVFMYEGLKNKHLSVFLKTLKYNFRNT